MRSLVRGIRSIELQCGNLQQATEFYSQVWNLTETDRSQASAYLRGTGPYHHILALHVAKSGVGIRCIVFDASSRQDVLGLHDRVKSTGFNMEKPHDLKGPGGGFGFGFADFEGRNYAIVFGVADHPMQSDDIDLPRKIAHININAIDLDRTNSFFIEVLGFTLIDQTRALSFLHCNSTDHNSIVVCAADSPTLNHIAFELPSLESVMRGAGRMRDAGYPIEWGVGRHGAGNNVFAYFAGPDEIPLEYTAEVLQVDDTYVPRGPDYWRFPAGRADQWGVTPPHTARWKRIQTMHRFIKGGFQI